MLWIINFFIDVANVLALWVPLLCYLVIGGVRALCGVEAVWLRALGAEGRPEGSLRLSSWPSSARGFITYQNALDVTMNFPATVHADGQPFAYFTNAPQLMGTTPQGWFVATVQTFMPFFKAFGSATILRGVFRGAARPSRRRRRLGSGERVHDRRHPALQSRHRCSGHHGLRLTFGDTSRVIRVRTSESFRAALMPQGG